jgi:hypothetical protein
MASSLTINGVTLSCTDLRESVIAIAAELDDWANAVYL